MVLTLTLRVPTPLPVELEGLTPDWVLDKSLNEIERFQVFNGNRKLPLAEFFSITGDATDGSMVFLGDLSNIHWIGAHMKSGEVLIEGNAGRHVGSQMRGGRLTVHGDCDDYTGAEMRGGRLRVRGNCGVLTGGAYRGSTKGMTGGTILVHGSAGDECGSLMRRGLIAIAQSCGHFAAYHMIAGTIAVFGECGRHPGAGMKRGTIALLNRIRPELLPSFQYSATMKLQSYSVLLRHLGGLDFPIPTVLAPHGSVEIYRGDKVSLGLGEVLFPATA